MSKPGGLSTTEAAVKGVPLVHLTPLPGWEENNIRFFTSRGLSLSGATPKAMAEQAVFLLKHPEERVAMIKRQHQQINPDAASTIIDYVQSVKRSDKL